MNVPLTSARATAAAATAAVTLLFGGALVQLKRSFHQNTPYIHYLTQLNRNRVQGANDSDCRRVKLLRNALQPSSLRCKAFQVLFARNKWPCLRCRGRSLLWRHRPQKYCRLKDAVYVEIGRARAGAMNTKALHPTDLSLYSALLAHAGSSLFSLFILNTALRRKRVAAGAS